MARPGAPAKLRTMSPSSLLLLLFLLPVAAQGRGFGAATPREYESRLLRAGGGEVSRDRGRGAEARARAKAALRVVLVLGTGCSASYNNTKLENECAVYYGEYARYQPWSPPQPPCHVLPAIDPARAEMEFKLGWHLNCDYRIAYTANIRRAAPHLRELGWENFVVVEYLSEEEREQVPIADVIIAPQNEFQDDLQERYKDKKFIVVHTEDQATISPDLDVNSDQVVGVLMHTSFTDLQENNRPSPEFMRHCAWMIPEERLKGLDIWSRSPPISEESLKKIHTVIPQILRWAHPLDCGGHPEFSMYTKAFNAEVDPEFSPPLHQRPIDMAFVGAVGEAMEIQHAPGQHVDPKDPDAVWVESLRSRTGVIAHRQKAIDRMKAVADKHNLTISWQDHKMKYDNFVKLLKKTKVFLSPFGLGEFSGKDYEAIMSGAVVVKPLASKIRSFPNIYEPHYMLEVDKDFSNLEEAVMPILNNVDSLRHNGQRMVDRGQQHLKNYGVGRFAQQLDHVLETIVLDPRMASSIRTS